MTSINTKLDPFSKPSHEGTGRRRHTRLCIRSATQSLWSWAVATLSFVGFLPFNCRQTSKKGKHVRALQERTDWNCTIRWVPAWCREHLMKRILNYTTTPTAVNTGTNANQCFFSCFFFFSLLQASLCNTSAGGMYLISESLIFQWSPLFLVCAAPRSNYEPARWIISLFCGPNDGRQFLCACTDINLLQDSGQATAGLQLMHTW